MSEVTVDVVEWSVHCKYDGLLHSFEVVVILQFGLERTGTAPEFMILGFVSNTSGNSVCLTFR